MHHPMKAKHCRQRNPNHRSYSGAAKSILTIDGKRQPWPQIMTPMVRFSGGPGQQYCFAEHSSSAPSWHSAGPGRDVISTILSRGYLEPHAVAVVPNSHFLQQGSERYLDPRRQMPTLAQSWHPRLFVNNHIRFSGTGATVLHRV